MSTFTQEHVDLCHLVYDKLEHGQEKSAAQLIADSEAAARQKVRAERDQLRAEVRKRQEQIGQQLAACDCAAMMDTPETHEKNKTVTRENPFWSNAFESVMRRTAECIALRAELAKERARLAKALRALSVILQDFTKHGESVANYSDGEYTQDYTTRSELLNSAIQEDTVP